MDLAGTTVVLEEGNRPMNLPARRVLVATERADVRAHVCARLAADGVAALGEGTGVDLELVGRVFAPQVAVLDLGPGGCASPLWRLDPRRATAAILLPTPDVGAADLATAWRTVAADIAPDPADVADIHRRVTAVLRRVDGHGSDLDDLVIDEAGHVARRGDVELELTLTEYRLLVAFVTNTGVVMSKRQLLASVWGFDDYHVNLVEVHVSALRRKLEAHGPRVIHTVRGIGYVFRRPVRADPFEPPRAARRDRDAVG